MLISFCENFFGVATKYRAHPGFGAGRRRRHRLTALADENHGLLGGQHSGPDRGGYLTDRMPGTGTDLGESGSWVREQTEQGD